MVYQVRWSHEALSDVEEIAQFIARDSSRYAGIVVEKILEATRQLEQFPRAGRKVPELNEEAIRELFVYNYRIIYRIQNEIVTIIAVIHGKRLLEDLMTDIVNE